MTDVTTTTEDGRFTNARPAVGVRPASDEARVARGAGGMTAPTDVTPTSTRPSCGCCRSYVATLHRSARLADRARTR